MTGDPFDFRCRRCNAPLLDDADYCDLPCRTPRQEWADLGGRIRSAMVRWFEAQALPVTPAALSAELLWWVRFDLIDPAGIPMMRDWLQLHGINTLDLRGAYLEVVRRPAGTCLEVYLRTAEISTPLIWEPPYLAAAHTHGFISSTDTASAQPSTVA